MHFEQNRYSKLVFQAMGNIRNDKIPNSVSKLDSDQLDTLMKYVLFWTLIYVCTCMYAINEDWMRMHSCFLFACSADKIPYRLLLVAPLEEIPRSFSHFATHISDSHAKLWRHERREMQLFSNGMPKL